MSQNIREEMRAEPTEIAVGAARWWWFVSRVRRVTCTSLGKTLHCLFAPLGPGSQSTNLSPFTSVVEKNSSVIGTRVLALGVIVAGLLAFFVFRHWFNSRRLAH
ncbi:hypothetical protein FA15DRAFT_706391 [Coprinopsis marcescibilis]|uniref:Uncharacterized protein n=1 Tax=Coprinopsis marcescibilis TaxID=230819 RepID=A0A5C3KQF2_COPMA|nr:hypothetical protein FA15DRAFT_710805 [Coprinopsis marcescibilis]TFK22437.1 hypothetical protein FA15DRAFT_706391 [Coprinopsis marcescibilis]